ncbi:uncharacterized protein LOC141553575 isoform X2 [Sminthopsis crassicaudata]|uniref:uncharacterized protein LOC141553575 isoform X2 n=1 Tax=Sminthopsis crassicaudata TaxID=9301 RepID=UPI003D697DC7
MPLAMEEFNLTASSLKTFYHTYVTEIMILSVLQIAKHIAMNVNFAMLLRTPLTQLNLSIMVAAIMFSDYVDLGPTAQLLFFSSHSLFLWLFI